MAVFFALYQFFRTAPSADELRPQFTGSSADFAVEARAGAFAPGTVVRVSGAVSFAESISLELDGGVIATKDSSDTQEWPDHGTLVVQGFYNGVEVDDFFGDTLVRLGGCFLLEATESEDLD